MAYYEGSYKQLLFGVSQQARKDRLDGQVEVQVNMTADLTFGLRRRSAGQLAAITDAAEEDWGRIAFLFTEVSGARVLVAVDTVAGNLTVRGVGGLVLHTAQADYLKAPRRQDIVFAVVQDSLYIGNISKAPSETPATEGYPDPDKRGFFFVSAGAYSKEFSVTIGKGSEDHTVSITSPSTTNPTGAQPEAIADALVKALAANPNVGTASGYTYTRTGAYVFITSTHDMSVASGSGTTYIKSSGKSNVPQVADLPATLPGEADGYIVAVGTSKTKVYYRWDSAGKAWLEDAAWSDLTAPTQMPMRLRVVEAAWVFDTPEYERRTSGDATTNPPLAFLTRPLTGMTSFQGRLVLLAGDFVCMSGSNRPERWYRSTVSQLEADDPIEVAASSTLATPYKYGVQFNQDLVLFSEKYQATVPGRAALTPSNATLSISSTYTADVGVQPVPVGLSLYFATPRAAGWAGVWEMTPSPYNETQLSAQDVTGHIPQYIRGPVRFIAASTTTNIVVVGDSADLTELVVHEYLWEGAEKVHQAWHRWKFALPTHFAYFDGDVVYLVQSGPAGEWVTLRVDIREGAGDSGLTAGRVDYCREYTVDSAGAITVPQEVYSLWAYADSAVPGQLPVAFHLSGESRGVREALFDYTDSAGSRVYTTSATEGTVLRVGSLYLSTVTPSAPVVRDQNEVPITTQRAQLHKFVVSLQNTGEFTYQTSDHYRVLDPVLTSPLQFGSPELKAGAPQVADGVVYIPCRLDMQTTLLTMSTSDVYDMNITSLEYGFRYHQRHGRRQ